MGQYWPELADEYTFYVERVMTIITYVQVFRT
jgi:hypothetical protein